MQDLLKNEWEKFKKGGTFSDIAVCKNCIYFQNGCDTIGKNDPNGHCGKFTQGKNNYVEEKDESFPSIQIKLPKNGRLISEFAREVVSIIKNENKFFFREDIREIVEIGTITNNEQETFTGFIEVEPPRFITLAERYFAPGNIIMNKQTEEFEFKSKSMTGELANILLKSQILQGGLPNISRIFTIPMPILYQGNLTFPNKGYDSRFNSWLPFDAPEIANPNMPLEEAKKLIKEIYKDFCFQTKQDYINAIAGLITPCLRGLFNRFSCRTPLFFYIANRERAGKDYLAGITGIVYEGVALEEPPICHSDENKSSSNDELKKKILTAFVSGRKRLHFANNKGYLDNAVFEGIITAEKYSDRLLGKNESPTFDNEIDFSLSGNIGIGFTPDLANRSRFIRLFLDMEDANARVFSNPDLHGWVKSNRSLILSAIYSLIKNWVDKGCPVPNNKFSSFPEWARVCGGIMESAGYESPNKPDKETLSLGGDTETQDMKRLFEICFEKKEGERLTKSDIKRLIMEGEDNLFGYLNFDTRSDQIKFASKIIKFTGRVLSGIRMVVVDTNVRASRQEYMFIKDVIELNKNLIFGEEEVVM
jgi:hypothetical protein